MPPQVRKGQAPPPHPRDEFRQRFLQDFFDPAYDAERDAISRLEAIAWKAYEDGRKAPRTRKAGPEFADPDYDLSIEWYQAHENLKLAQARWGDAATASRVLLVAGG